jgi:hypothetical protein
MFLLAVLVDIPHDKNDNEKKLQQYEENSTKFVTTILRSDNAIYFHEKCNNLRITKKLMMVR